jgi:CubicO group peptidase (beta-lactamase class C family)
MDRITIGHLLSHTAGLVREPPAFSPLNAATTDAELIRSAYATPLRFAPGEKWEYSNLGYVLLAEIIARVSGQPWSQFMTEQVFAPAGMIATRTTTTAPMANKAVGYSDNNKLIDAPDWPAVRAGGAFLSTVLDLAKWEGVLRTNSILSESTRAAMWSTTRLNSGMPALYGFGWHVNRPGARRVVWHSGGLPGFKAQYRRYIDEGVTVIILMNIDDADDESIAFGVAERYLSGRK